MMRLEDEIRKIPINVRCELAAKLEVNEEWKTLMGIIPKSPIDSNKKYNSEHVRIIEEEARRRQRPAFDVLIEEWGTSGKKRPDIKLLLELLTLAELYNAADYVSVEILNLDPVARPAAGPSAPISNKANAQTLAAVVNKPEEVTNVQPRNQHALDVKASADISLENLSGTLPPIVRYAELAFITDNFNEIPFAQSGRKLGTGAFGTVFLGKLPTNQLGIESELEMFKSLGLSKNAELAVKRLHDPESEGNAQLNYSLFRTEIETMYEFQHENLLTLLGYSIDGPNYCLVYHYMSNGSLESRLASMDSKPLEWNQRLDIANGVARALVHLHTSSPRPLVHRDVKSANVLLDHDYKPKLGDFGLIRVGAGPNGSKTSMMTSTIIGTTAYMAPEAFRGDISPKLDTFSFGVIIAELMTGLPPCDEEREEYDLLTYLDNILESRQFIELLDPRLLPLPEDMCAALYDVYLNCRKEKKHRPTMVEVRDALLNIPYL